MPLIQSQPAPLPAVKARKRRGAPQAALADSAFDPAAPQEETPNGQTLDGQSPDGQTLNGQTLDGQSPDGQTFDGEALDGQALANLESNLPATRRAAARQLGQHPEPDSPAGRGFAAALAGRLPREPYRSVREVLFTSLVRLANPEVVAQLAECLRSPDASLRNEAIEALQELPQEFAFSIRSLLHDPDPDVRIFAINILESFSHPQVESWLIEVVESDPQLNVCATAIDLLAEVGTEAAREPLRRVRARFPNAPYLHFAVDVALRRLGGG